MKAIYTLLTSAILSVALSKGAEAGSLEVSLNDEGATALDIKNGFGFPEGFLDEDYLVLYDPMEHLTFFNRTKLNMTNEGSIGGYFFLVSEYDIAESLEFVAGIQSGELIDPLTGLQYSTNLIDNLNFYALFDIGYNVNSDIVYTESLLNINFNPTFGDFGYYSNCEVYTNFDDAFALRLRNGVEMADTIVVGIGNGIIVDDINYSIFFLFE